MSPNEIALADNGNFLVRDRARRVLEILASGQCNFYPTCFKGTTEITPWQLAVPANQVEIAKVEASIPRCESCGEPRSAHPGTQFSAWIWDGCSEYHILKSATWGSSENGWKLWMNRDRMLSVCLFNLFNRIGVKGLDERTCSERTQPNDQESTWILEKLKLLTEQGVPAAAPGAVSDEDLSWFRKFLKHNAAADPIALEVRSVETRFKFKLPKSYVEFIKKVGPRSFHDVDEEEGLTVTVLTPDEFDVESYRKGMLEAPDELTDAVDGVMFAKTEFGDCFCFDVAGSKNEHPVYLYNHEFNSFEPYADNFAACVRRFAGE